MWGMSPMVIDVWCVAVACVGSRGEWWSSSVAKRTRRVVGGLWRGSVLVVSSWAVVWACRLAVVGVVRVSVGAQPWVSCCRSRSQSRSRMGLRAVVGCHCGCGGSVGGGSGVRRALSLSSVLVTEETEWLLRGSLSRCPLRQPDCIRLPGASGAGWGGPTEAAEFEGPGVL